MERYNMEKALIIVPFASVGNVAFDSKREDVRNLGSYTEFKKSRFSKNTTDNFGGYHVFYTPNNEVEAVEIFPFVKAVYNGKNLFELSKQEVISLFGDVNFKEEEESLVFPSYGIEVVIEEERVSSVFAHMKDY